MIDSRLVEAIHNAGGCSGSRDSRLIPPLRYEVELKCLCWDLAIAALRAAREAGADKIDTRTGSLEHWRVGQDTWNKGRPVLVPPRPGGRRMMRSPRNQLAEAFIRGIEAGVEQPTLAGDGDAMYQAFREWADEEDGDEA